MALRPPPYGITVVDARGIYAAALEPPVEQPSAHADPGGLLQRRAATAGPAEGAVMEGAMEVASAKEVASEGIRGAGSALPHLASIQRAFGRHDLSAVRAHIGGAATAAATAMGAEAYATGNDVVFAGTPSLHTAAHEAAHVVQQRGGVHLKDGVGEVGDPHERHADAVANCVVHGRSAEALLDRYSPAGGEPVATTGGVQRKVGLEFETNVPVRTLKGERLEYKKRVLTAKGWHVEADSSNLEFVTEPFQSWEELSEAVSGVVGLGKGIENHLRQPPHRARLDEYLVGCNKPMIVTSAPQATGGVPLDKIPEMFSSVASTRLDFLRKDPRFEEAPEKALTLMGMVPRQDEPQLSSEIGREYVDEILNEVKQANGEVPHHRFKKLEGLVTLIISYLGTGQEQDHRYSYSKIIATIMSRVNFAALYDGLDEDEKPYLTSKRLLEFCRLDPKERIFARGYGRNGDVSRGPTRKAWIDSIVDGQGSDLMSYGGGTTVAGGEGISKELRGWSGTSTSMGEMTEMDETPEGVNLAVLELRRLPKSIRVDFWPDVAMTVFKFFAAVDSSLTEKAIKRPPPIKPSIDIKEDKAPKENKEVKEEGPRYNVLMWTEWDDIAVKNYGDSIDAHKGRHVEVAGAKNGAELIELMLMGLAYALHLINAEVGADTSDLQAWKDATNHLPKVPMQESEDFQIGQLSARLRAQFSAAGTRHEK